MAIKIELTDLKVEKVTRNKGGWSLKMEATVSDDQGPVKDAEITLAIAKGAPGKAKVTDEHGKAYFDITRRTLDDFEFTFEAMGQKSIIMLRPSRHSTAQAALSPTAPTPTPAPTEPGEKEIEITEYLGDSGEFVLFVRVVGQKGEAGKTVVSCFFRGNLEEKETDDHGNVKLDFGIIEKGKTEEVTLTAPGVPTKKTVTLERAADPTAETPRPKNIFPTVHYDDHGNPTVAIQVTDICKNGVETDLTIVADGRTQQKRTEPNGWLTVGFGRALRQGEKAKMIIIIEGLAPKEVTLSHGQETAPERLRYQPPERLPRPKKPLSFLKLLTSMGIVLFLFFLGCLDYVQGNGYFTLWIAFGSLFFLPCFYWLAGKTADLWHHCKNALGIKRSPQPQ